MTAIIEKFYANQDALRDLLIRHSTAVAQRALRIARQHPELDIDQDFLYEAAMLHDIGIYLTDAPGICCYGTAPYICHGVLGAQLMRAEGLPRHARVCERHTGAGLTKREVLLQGLPVPVQDYLPETLEEQLVCYADKFYSKSHPDREKTPAQALKSLLKFGPEGAARFRHWMELFCETGQEMP